MGAKPQGVWGRSPPAGSRGGTPVGSLGNDVHRSCRIFKVVTSKYYAFLVVFHTYSHIYAYVFSVLAGIIPLSLRNGGI